MRSMQAAAAALVSPLCMTLRLDASDGTVNVAATWRPRRGALVSGVRSRLAYPFGKRKEKVKRSCQSAPPSGETTLS